MINATSLQRTASWVIRERSTGRVIMETFSKAAVDKLNTVRYEAVPILEYLQGVNKAIRNAK